MMKSNTKKIEVLKETTDWIFPNHTYVLENGRLVAYKRKGFDGLMRLPSSTFIKKRRTFVNVKGEELKEIMQALCT
jgi:hypothetical protein